MIQQRHKKIVVYSHDTYGLGNMRRMLVIARALVDSDPNLSVLILSGSPMLHAFRISPRIDYIKLPCLTRTMSGDYEAKSLNLAHNQILRMRSNLIRNSIIDFDPDLILVDKKPFGVADELANAFNDLKRLGHRAKLVLLLRDILDSAETTMQIWRKNAYHQAIDSFYDQVLVVGSPEIFDLCKEYEFPAKSRQKVRFCGYIAREAGRTSRQLTRQKYGCDTKKLILVTPGGGEDGFQLLKSYVQGWQEQGGIENAKTLVICGPEMKENHRNEILSRIGDSHDIVLENFTDDMMAYMDAADLVISMGGYNTVCEILTLGKRAIVVPRVTPVLEQWIRAKRMDSLGLLRALHPDEMTPSSLLATVRGELARPFYINSSTHFNINLDGLASICRSIHTLMMNDAVVASLVVNKPKNIHPVNRQEVKADYILGYGSGLYAQYSSV